MRSRDRLRIVIIGRLASRGSWAALVPSLMRRHRIRGVATVWWHLSVWHYFMPTIAARWLLAGGIVLSWRVIPVLTAPTSGREGVLGIPMRARRRSEGNYRPICPRERRWLRSPVVAGGKALLVSCRGRRGPAAILRMLRWEASAVARVIFDGRHTR